jgi:hypothetical protein
MFLLANERGSQIKLTQFSFVSLERLGTYAAGNVTQ